MPWTVISDATLEVGKALRALTMRNLRDNFAAMAAGDAGAPQIQTAAIAASAVTTAKIADSNVTTGKIATGAVAAWNASLGTGEIGTYAWLTGGLNVGFTAGTNYSGLVYTGLRVNNADGTAVVNISGAAGGTWKAMGTIAGATSRYSMTVFLRIA